MKKGSAARDFDCVVCQRLLSVSNLLLGAAAGCGICGLIAGEVGVERSCRSKVI